MAETTRAGTGLVRALGAALRVAPLLTVGLTVLALLEAALPAVIAVSGAHLIAAIPAAHRAHGTGAAERTVTRFLVLTGTLYVVGQVLPVGHELLAGRLGRRLNAHLQRRVMLACQAPAHLELFDDPEVLAAISLVRDDTNGLGLPGDAIAAFFGVAGQKLRGAGGAVALAHYSLLYGVVGFAVYVALMSGILRSLQLLAASHVEARESFLPAEYLRTVSLSPGPAREVRVFGLSGWLRARSRTAYTGAMHALWRRRDSYLLSFSVGMGAVLLVLAGAFFTHLADQLQHGRISLAALLAVLSSGLLTIGGGSFSGEDLKAMQGTAAMAGILSLERSAGAARGLTPTATLAPTAPERDLVFEAVTFRHPGSDHDVLRELDLVIPAGQRLALVGVNGAGKTTLATVLSGLRPPTNGRLLVDGTDLAAVDPKLWQRRVAVLSQDFVRYPMSAYDNVAVGAPELADDPGSVRRAAALAGATDLVDDLPQGWDTLLMSGVAEGGELSGGQWQRLGLARALLAVAAGAQVLVLDEPTSALDVRAEAALFSSLLAMPELTGVTVVLISHRFSSVRQADRIVVLQDGVVLEDGTHTQLLAAGQEYASMFTLQAELFREPDGGGVRA